MSKYSVKEEQEPGPDGVLRAVFYVVNSVGRKIGSPFADFAAAQEKCDEFDRRDLADLAKKEKNKAQSR